MNRAMAVILLLNSAMTYCVYGDQDDKNSEFVKGVREELVALGCDELAKGDLRAVLFTAISFTTWEQQEEFLLLQAKVAFYIHRHEAPTLETLSGTIVERVDGEGPSLPSLAVSSALNLLNVADEYGVPDFEAVQTCYDNNSDISIRNQCIALMFKIREDEGRRRADQIMITEQVPLRWKMDLSFLLRKFGYVNSYRIMEDALISPDDLTRQSARVMLMYFLERNGQRADTGVINTTQLLANARKKLNEIETELTTLERHAASEQRQATQQGED